MPIEGQKTSDKTRKKISESLKGFKHTEETKKNMSESGKSAWTKERREEASKKRKGKQYSEETKQNMKDSWTPEKRKAYSERISKQQLGSANPNWKHGDYGLSNWRLMVKLRDNCQCQDCYINEFEHQRKYGFSLHVHHIDENKLNNRIENGKTVCVSCHTKHHNYNRKLTDY